MGIECYRAGSRNWDTNRDTNAEAARSHVGAGQMALSLEGNVCGPAVHTLERIIIPIIIERTDPAGTQSRLAESLSGYRTNIVYYGPALPIVRGSRIKVYFHDSARLRSPKGGIQQEVAPFKIELLAQDGSVAAIVNI